MKFSREVVLKQVELVHQYELHLSDSPVYEAWANLADEWLANSDGEIHRHGFEGFFDRSPEKILVDFHINGLLEDELSQEELDELLK